MPQTTHSSSTTAPLGTHHENSQTSPSSDTQPRVLREPPTGKQFLDSLQDGRVIYFDGKLVKDVTTHLLFPPAPARMPACTTDFMTPQNGTY